MLTGVPGADPAGHPPRGEELHPGHQPVRPPPPGHLQGLRLAGRLSQHVPWIMPRIRKCLDRVRLHRSAAC